MPSTQPPARQGALSKASLVRLSPEDYQRMTAAARNEDRTLAAWLRRQGRLALANGQEQQAA